ncbi:MAG: ParA family protein [Luteococcus sp.]|uniref:ParA family protein n=1 Tax=Luteococcus sp. TaxID=1969402 RepID=UPI002648F56D|nr:ParA family protein [Luteococcus sp.]MDN5562575.1 ParA family protein [Luteococcus sp.]
MSSDNGLSAQSRELQGLMERVHEIAQTKGPVSIAVVNRKGGVGKSSIVTNMACELARRGLKVLVVGLCGQVGVAVDLGARNLSDEGASIADYVLGEGDDVAIVPNVRPNLDVIFGGKRLPILETLVGENAKSVPGGDAIARFRDVMLAKFDPYDVVLMDFPPQQTVTQMMGFTVTDWVLIPTRNDDESMNGVAEMPDLLENARRLNPDIQVLGVTLFMHPTRSTAVRREWQEEMAQIAPQFPVLDTFIPHSLPVSAGSRKRGVVVRELVPQLAGSIATRIQALREGKSPARAISESTAKSIADAYEALTLEVIRKIVEAAR